MNVVTHSKGIAENENQKNAFFVLFFSLTIHFAEQDISLRTSLIPLSNQENGEQQRIGVAMCAIETSTFVLLSEIRGCILKQISLSNTPKIVKSLN